MFNSCSYDASVTKFIDYTTDYLQSLTFIEKKSTDAEPSCTSFGDPFRQVQAL